MFNRWKVKRSHSRTGLTAISQEFGRIFGEKTKLVGAMTRSKVFVNVGWNSDVE